MTTFKKLTLLMRVVLFVWCRKRLLFNFLAEVESINRCVFSVQMAYKMEDKGRHKAQTNILELLGYRSFCELLAMSNLVSEGKSFETLKACVADDFVFGTAWKIICGDLGFLSSATTRIEHFLLRLREVFPMARSLDKSLTSIGDCNSVPLAIDENLAPKVIDAVGLLFSVVFILPGIFSVFGGKK